MKDIKEYLIPINESGDNRYAIVFVDAQFKESAKTESDVFGNFNELKSYITKYYEKDDITSILNTVKSLKQGQCIMQNVTSSEGGPNALLISCI